VSISGKWKRLSGDAIEDFEKTLKEDVEKELADGNELRFIVGCDSQVKSGKVIYVTAIALHRVGKGGLVYWLSDVTPRNHIQPKRRLWNEAYKAVAVALELDEVLEQYGLEVNEVHSDLNRSKKHLSGEIVQEVCGYVVGCGFTSIVKPTSWAASKVCDRICKR